MVASGDDKLKMKQMGGTAQGKGRIGKNGKKNLELDNDDDDDDDDDEDDDNDDLDLEGEGNEEV